MRDMTAMSEATVLTNLRRSTLEFCVLAWLQRGPAYGLEIARGLGEEAGLFESEGTLYPLLARLRKSGYATTSWDTSADGAPRRYYAITDAGREALSQFTDIWTTYSARVDVVLEGARS